MNSQELSLDLSKETRLQQPIRIRQGDLEGTTIVARIYDGGVAATTTGLSAYVVMELPDREHYYRKQASLSGNVATVTIDEAEAASVTGMTDNAYFQLVGEGVIYSTSRFTVTVLKGAIDGHDTAETYDGYVEDWLEEQTASIGSTMSNAITAMNNAANEAISDANAAASAASAAATDAEDRIEAAIEAAGDISELAVPLMSADTRGGAKLGDGLAVDDGTLHVGQLTKASTGEVYGPLASVTAKGHAEQFSTTGKNLWQPDASGYKNACTVSLDGDEYVFVATGSDMFVNYKNSVGNAFSNGNGIKHPVSGGSTYYLTISNSIFTKNWLDFYDESETCVSDVAFSNSEGSFTVPANAVFMTMRFGYDNSVAGTTYRTSIQLELGSTATEYEPYTGGAPSPRPDWEQPIEVVSGRNLIDESKSIVGMRINTDGTEITAAYAAGNTTSDYIPISHGASYYASNVLGTSLWYPVFFYDSNKDFISYMSLGNRANVSGSFVAPDNASYVRVTYHNQGSSSYVGPPMLTIGTTLQPYVPYGHVGMEARDPDTDELISCTALPLPSRGWVAGLPDGTADSLRLDGAGKCEWELGTGETKLGELSWGDYSSPSNHVFRTPTSGITPKPMTTDIVATASLSSHYIAKAYGPLSASDDGCFAIAREEVNRTIFIDHSSSTAAEFAENNADVTLLYPLATPVTEDCGYVDLPDIPSEATVSIPELEELGLTFWVDGDGTIRAAMREWYERAHSEYADRLTALEEAVAALVTQ